MGLRSAHLSVYTVYLLKEITMLVEFCKWGNSLAVRIPKTLADSLKVGVGRHAEIAIENGALVLRPIRRPKRKPTYTLEELLRGMTKENVPQEVDWGEPRRWRQLAHFPTAIRRTQKIGLVTQTPPGSQRFCFGSFRSRTPFSSKNSTPADSRAALSAASFAAVTGISPSIVSTRR
jgi:antitoxin MazE